MFTLSQLSGTMINAMTEENKNYEIGFLVKTELDKDEIVKAVKSSEFSIIGEGPVSRIKLSYPIKKENYAYFGYLHFSGSPANVQGLNDKLKTGSKVLRFSIVPQPIVKEVRISEQDSSVQTRHFSERRKAREVSSRPLTSQSVKESPKPEVLSNEALEKKLEEILK